VAAPEIISAVGLTDGSVCGSPIEQKGNDFGFRVGLSQTPGIYLWGVVSPVSRKLKALRWER
jgi:hypothetical protein